MNKVVVYQLNSNIFQQNANKFQHKHLTAGLYKKKRKREKLRRNT